MLTTLRIVPAQAAEQHTLPRTHSAGTGARVRRASVQPCGQVPMHFSEQSKELAVIEKISKNTKGGPRAGSGRKPGSPNKKTADLQKAVESSGITPLEYMLSVMRNADTEPRERLAAAQSAAPYVHAKLASIELSGPNGGAVPLVARVELVALK